MANMITVLNTILANGSADYQSRVPTATQTNINEVGTAVLSNAMTTNEFLTSLVDKIALQMVRNKTFRNPLAVLKKGGVPLGRGIEDIYVNPATAEGFDGTGTDLLSSKAPDSFTLYYKLNRRDKYKVSVSKAKLIQSFMSYEALEQLLNSIVNTIYSGDNFDEFTLMKNTLGKVCENAQVYTISDITPVTDAESAKDFVKIVKTVGQSMTFPSSTYNMYSTLNEGAKDVITWTPLENQVLILRSDIAVNVDMEVLAQAFNVSYAELKQRTLIVDNFGVASAQFVGMLIDESYLQVYDNLTQLENFRNPSSLDETFYYHHWQTYGVAHFANAVAFKVAEA